MEDSVEKNESSNDSGAFVLFFIGLEAFGISWNGWLTEEDSRADILELTNPLDSPLHNILL